jgi:hypothetical protein
MRFQNRNKANKKTDKKAEKPSSAKDPLRFLLFTIYYSQQDFHGSRAKDCPCISGGFHG